MRSIFFGLAVAGGSALVYLLGHKLLRYWRRVEADARARVFLETWRDREREAKRIEAWSKSDVRHERGEPRAG